MGGTGQVFTGFPVKKKRLKASVGGGHWPSFHQNFDTGQVFTFYNFFFHQHQSVEDICQVFTSVRIIHQWVEDTGQVFFKILTLTKFSSKFWHWPSFHQHFDTGQVFINILTLAKCSSKFWHWPIYTPIEYQHLSHLNLVHNILSLTVNRSCMHRFKHICPSNLILKALGGFMDRCFMFYGFMIV